MTDEKQTVQLVEQHIIQVGDPRFDILDQAAFASKNLYNLANYVNRQRFFAEHKTYTYETLYHLLKGEDAYQALPAKVSQQTIKQLCRNWKAYWMAHRDWRQNPDKYLGEPRIPKYKDKTEGRFLLVYTDQAVSRKDLKQGIVNLSGLGPIAQTKQRNIDQVRIVPRKDRYVVEIVYTVEVEPNPDLNPAWFAGLDVNLDILAAIASNKPGFQPLVVNGRPLKNTNQYYNKRKAALQSELPGQRQSSRRINKIGLIRENKINHYLHVASRTIIDLLVREQIGTLIIGKNKNWKQAIEIGHKNNQNFVSIPHARFIEMITYKAQLAGIRVIEQEESYTSKCSFLDLEPVRKHTAYFGRRIKRGLFKSSEGRLIHADVNAAYNLIRKAFPGTFPQGIEGVVVRPVRLRLNLGANEL